MFTLAANSQAQVTLNSDPISLGTVTTDATGALNATLTIPADVAPGYHTLSITGTSYSGEPITLWQVIEVRSADAPQTPYYTNLANYLAVQQATQSASPVVNTQQTSSLHQTTQNNHASSLTSSIPTLDDNDSTPLQIPPHTDKQRVPKQSGTRNTAVTPQSKPNLLPIPLAIIGLIVVLYLAIHFTRRHIS